MSLRADDHRIQWNGYNCNVCDCVITDSISFLDHINGEKHQRNLGMSMRVERTSLDSVKKRFEMNQKKMEDYDMQVKLQQIADVEEKLKEYRPERRNEKRKIDVLYDGQESTNELVSVMGFAGFGPAKKKVMFEPMHMDCT